MIDRQRRALIRTRLPRVVGREVGLQGQRRRPVKAERQEQRAEGRRSAATGARAKVCLAETVEDISFSLGARASAARRAGRELRRSIGVLISQVAISSPSGGVPAA